MAILCKNKYWIHVKLITIDVKTQHMVKTANMKIDTKFMEGFMVPEKNVTKKLLNRWTHSGLTEGRQYTCLPQLT